jgi:hypothetical protein
LSWLARTPEAALRAIRKTVAEVVRDMRESGKPVPEPIASKHSSGKFMVRVPPEVHRNLARYPGRRSGGEPEPAGERETGAVGDPSWGMPGLPVRLEAQDQPFSESRRRAVELLERGRVAGVLQALS